MNAITAFPNRAHVHALPLDDIRCFLPGIGEEEYARRDKLRRYRNVATALLSRTESPTARIYAWPVNDFISELLFSPASPALLVDVAKFCNRALITALHAERLELGAIS